MKKEETANKVVCVSEREGERDLPCLLATVEMKPEKQALLLLQIRQTISLSLSVRGNME